MKILKMRYTSRIDNVKSKEWGLSLSEAYLFSWIYEVPSWADNLIINNEVYYFASRTKAIEDLSLLTDKTDTVYRYYKSLEGKNLIDILKFDGKDYIKITEKAKSWNAIELGNKSENSDLNPTNLGNKSENNSDLNPTYYNTIIDYNTNDKYFEESVDSSENSDNKLFGETPKPKSKKEKKEKVPSHPAYVPIIKFFCEEYWPDYKFFGARDGKQVKEIISQIERMLSRHGEDYSAERVVEFFSAVVTNAPQFYQKKSLPVINSKFSEIVEEIKKERNGQKNSKNANPYLQASAW